MIVTQSLHTLNLRVIRIICVGTKSACDSSLSVGLLAIEYVAVTGRKRVIILFLIGLIKLGLLLV